MVHTEGENNRIEIWKDYKDYEGLYQASNLGRMRSLDTYRKGRNGSIRFCKGRILKPGTDKDGYLQVCLCKNNKQKTYKVHRLVAETFIPNPDNLPYINHRDECKTNNNVENLEWCDCKYNSNYGTRNKKVALKKKKPVLQFTLDGIFVKEWPSTIDAEREGGFVSASICRCCRGRSKKHHNFIWKYK